MTTAHGTRRRGRIAGLRPDLALLAAGTVLLVLAAWPVSATHVTRPEAGVFGVLNHTDVLPFAVIWPVMQLGNLLVVPCAALVAAAFRRWRLAAELLLAGAAVYLLAKVVKTIVVRGRPDHLLTDVVIRGTPALGRGFLSGHAAVVTALLAVAWPWLGRPARIVFAVLAAAVCLARVHVGAHLPLDVVGGAALGLAVAGLVRLALGRPR
jgi:membrane-associated phospholipid phosphatase